MTFEALVNRVLDKEISGHGITKREALAELFVNQLLAKRNDAPFGHYIRRGWPEVLKHEITAEVAEVGVNYSNMTTDELRELRRLQRKGLGHGS